MKCNDEKWCDQHVTNMGQRKNLSPWQELNLCPSVHWSDALTTELRKIRDQLGYTQGWCMTCLLRNARILISLMILAVCTMHVIYESCRWSSSPHNSNTSVTVSHISYSISGSKFWLVLQNPSTGTELYASVHTHLTIKSVTVEEWPIKISWERLKTVENIHCLKSQTEIPSSNVNGKYPK